MSKPTNKRRTTTKIERKIRDLFKDIGTISFYTFEELSMMLDEVDVGKVRREVLKLKDDPLKKDRIFLDFNGKLWRLDYIPF